MVSARTALLSVTRLCFPYSAAWALRPLALLLSLVFVSGPALAGHLPVAPGSVFTLYDCEVNGCWSTATYSATSLNGNVPTDIVSKAQEWVRYRMQSRAAFLLEYWQRLYDPAYCCNVFIVWTDWNDPTCFPEDTSSPAHNGHAPYGHWVGCETQATGRYYPGWNPPVDYNSGVIHIDLPYDVFAATGNCHISLSGFPAEVEPGMTVGNLQARVTCTGKSPEGIAVTITPDVEDNSGGHQHIHGRRPQHVGAASGGVTDANGNVPFTFTAPAPAGDHTVTAKCVDDSCGEATGKVWVGIKGLVSLYDTHLYKLVGSDDVHPNNHYLTMAATGSVVWLAELYRARFPNDPVLYLNDASLERGGLFDIKHDRRTQWWTPPHETHRHGKDIDVRANEFVHADAIPHRNYFDFEEIAIDVGCKAGMHGEFTTNQHYHMTCG